MPSSPESPSLLLHRINPNHTNHSPGSCKQSGRTPPPHYEYHTPSPLPEAAVPHHTYLVGPDQCCSAVIQEIAAPAATVWSIVRRFDNPKTYKHFVKTCNVVSGDGTSVGTLREIQVISGLPAVNSTERLEILDDELHVISFSVVGGDHRLFNYRSVTSLHASAAAPGRTVVVESYIVDIPAGNTKEETSVFVDTIVKCNLQSLARMAEDLALVTT